MISDIQTRRGCRALMLMQLFSMLGYSVLYSTLVLYATQGLHLSSQYSLALTGGFIAFNYTLHVLGGYIGGRLLSYRGLFLVGMLLQAIGCLVLSQTTFQTLLIGTSIFLAGCGLNVICINCMMTQLFDPQDKRRETAFLWNYSGMNFGFFIGFSVSGYFQIDHQYHALFIFASVGSLVSFVLTLVFWKFLADKNTNYSLARKKTKRIFAAGLIIIGLITALTWLLAHAHASNELIFLSGTLVALLFVFLAWKEKRKENSKKLWAFLILSLSSLIFWTLYQMAPMGLTLFYVHNVTHDFLGFTIAPQWTQNINTIVIVLGGPLMAALNNSLRKKGYKITLPFQFTTALLCIGLGYLLLPIGIQYANANGITSIGWFIGTYLMQSIGELFISPIGYAMIGQLIPTKLQAFAMGTWLMVSGIAATLANYFSQKAIGTTAQTNPLLTNPTFSSAFFKLALLAIAGSILVFLLRPFLHRLIQEKRNHGF
jgi:proton-dependent oligopeptide transporter, POT family